MLYKHIIIKESENDLTLFRKNLHKENWPLPLWIDPAELKEALLYKFQQAAAYYSYWGKIKFKLLKPLLFLFKHNGHYKSIVDEIIAVSFDANLKDIKTAFQNNPLFDSKENVIEAVFKLYRKKNWAICIISISALLDIAAKEILRLNNIQTGIKDLHERFQENKSTFKINKNIIGALNEQALQSFFEFAENYYASYNEAAGKNNFINKHGILHGSINSFSTKANTIRLFTFLYLMLELEPAFRILLIEDDRKR